MSNKEKLLAEPCSYYLLRPTCRCPVCDYECYEDEGVKIDFPEFQGTYCLRCYAE